MEHFVPEEAVTSLMIINTLLCTLTGWELSMGRTPKDDPHYGGDWVYVLRCHEKKKTIIAGRVVRV